MKPTVFDLNNSALLQSRNFARTSNICTFVYYYTFGVFTFYIKCLNINNENIIFQDDMGTLNLYKTVYNSEGYELIWSRSGNLGQTWIRNYIEIRSESAFKVQLKIFL